jgi:hypothetical protein
MDVERIVQEIMVGMDCVHPAKFESHVRAIVEREFNDKPKAE